MSFLEVENLISNLFDNNSENLRKISAKIDITERTLAEIVKQIDSVRLEPYDSFEFFIKRITTVGAVLPDLPSYTFKSKLEKETRLVALTLIPDGVFKSNGFLRIDIGDAKAAFQSVSGEFTDISTLNVIDNQAGKTLASQKSVDIFIASSGAAANLTVLATLAQFVPKK